jgi:hypothetical protein
MMIDDWKLQFGHCKQLAATKNMQVWANAAYDLRFHVPFVLIVNFATQFAGFAVWRRWNRGQ